MKKEQIITILENTVISANCPGMPSSVERARINLIGALKSGNRFIDYSDHHAVNIPGPCVCVRTLIDIACLNDDLLVHTGIYDTSVTYFTKFYNPDYYN